MVLRRFPLCFDRGNVCAQAAGRDVGFGADPYSRASFVRRGVDSSAGASTSDEDSGGARGRGASATWLPSVVASTTGGVRIEGAGDVVGVSHGDAGWDSYD